MKTVVKIDGFDGLLLADICERASGSYRRELATVADRDDVKMLSECLVNLMRLWEATDKFEADDALVLTIEKREEQE